MKQLNNDLNVPETAITAYSKRERYSSPTLKEYGKVANLTKAGGASVRSDSGMNGMWT
jgi:hypothetical protein